MVLIPLLVLGGLELILRLIGYGYPTRFFLKQEIGGREFYVPNDKFGYRFFPRALVRNPLPLRVPAAKATNCFRIFVLGGSAAQGDPDPTFGFGRYLQVLLRERYPGTDFEVVCVAMTAIDSHVVLPIARECARHQGDLWLIYMGNNEMVGPFGAGTVFGPATPALSFIRASLAMKATKIGQLIESLEERLGDHASTNQSWGGMKMFLDHQLRHDDPRRLRAYQYFRRNLEDILELGHQWGVPIILSTVGSNLKDCSPFGSLHAATLQGKQLSDWKADFQQGATEEDAGNFRAALNAYSNAAAIDPTFAELQFQIGKCYLALTNASPARHHFELARDDDTLAFRADTRINQIIKETAERYSQDGVHFLDAAAALAESSPEGIPGHELFYEHVHLNFAGNYHLAHAFAEQVDQLLPAPIRAHDRGAWLSEAQCDERLAVTIWDRYRLWNTALRRLFIPPFIGQSDHAAQIKNYEARFSEIAERMNTSETPADARKIYDQAIDRAPNDYFLHSNYSQFLDAIGDLAQALKEQQHVQELLPQTAVPYYRIGKLLVRQGHTSKAAEYFSRALAIQPDFVQALNEMGLLLANQHKTAEAVTYFSRAVRSDPDFAETYLNWGFVEQTDGKLDQAIQHYQDATRHEREGPAAFFAQGVAFAIQHRRNEAIQAFREAARLKPGFWQAHYLLGVELAEQDNVTAAQSQFAEVVSRRPDYARAHLNLGVALAKQGQLDRALAEFQTCLQLDPNNKLAQQHIETIQSLKARGL